MQYTVTQRVRAVHQPDGGHLPIKAFSIKHYQDNKILNPRENIRPNYIGLAVVVTKLPKILKNHLIFLCSVRRFSTSNMADIRTIRIASDYLTSSGKEIPLLLFRLSHTMKFIGLELPIFPDFCLTRLPQII